MQETGQDVLSNLKAALAMEWLVTNGLGGSASATIIGANSRRSHAMLTAAGPHGRLTTMLLRLNERVHASGAWHHLSSNLHAGPVVRPAGHEFLESFTLDPWPIWRWRVDDTVIEKSVFMVEGHNAVAATYRHVEGPALRIGVSPLVAGRDPRELLRAGEDEARAQAGQKVPGRVRIEIAPGLAALTVWHNGHFTPARVWVRDLVYPADVGSEPRATPDGDDREDAVTPCHIEATLEPAGELNVVAAAEDDLFKALAREDRLGTPPPKTLKACVKVLATERHREWAAWRASSIKGADFTARQAAVAHGDAGSAVARRLEPLIGRDDAWAGRLTDALYACMVRRNQRTTLLATLPRGEERGVDAMRAVMALVSLRQFDVAREVLRGYADYLNEGLAPERFDPGDGTPHYGDAAPALWFVHAAEAYVRRSEDIEFLSRVLYPPLESIMQSYRAGTASGIRTTADGLLEVRQDVGDVARADLNALWYHALVAMAQLARLVGRRENGAFYLAWARETQRQFGERLWDDERGCLFDSITPGGPQRGLTATQLLAATLAPPLLPQERVARLVETIGRELVTPYGVLVRPGGAASLAWVGAYVSAYLRVHGRSAQAHTRMREWMDSLRSACGRVSTNHVPEAFAADAPAGSPRVIGEPCSVVATAELLRAWVEEIDHGKAHAPATVAASA